ncbi:MAG TPA: serine/threonine-protein kinase, partial [Polyangiaceae bacterium]|nr:serine/threonine-protein kinase [Polyangiaceae bacterium]
MPWPPHRTLYELGHGGMGVVELAEVEGESGPRLVAIKRTLPYRGDDAKNRSAFLREARLLARIDHPNVVRALGVDEGEGGRPPALMMQYVAGVALKDLIAAGPGGLPVAVAARLGLDVARGLHAAHELCDEDGRRLDIVHRDVSPHNVLVTFDGRAVLLDFGVAKINDATRSLTGEVKGKLAYMAPEQAMADPVDRRSDLYALGALLYEMLSGRRMLGEGTDLEILRRMMSERPAPLASLRPDVPEGLAALVARMTDESPDRRPPDADAVAAALAPYADAAPAPALAAYLEARLPGARREHDQRIAAARAGSQAPPLSRPGPAALTLAAGRS